MSELAYLYEVSQWKPRKRYQRVQTIMRRIDRELAERMRVVDRYLCGVASKEEYEEATQTRPLAWSTTSLTGKIQEPSL